MSDIRHMLSPEERVEYDALVYEALHDGIKRRKSAEVGPEFRRLLRDAEQAGRVWATWVREDAEVDGLRSRAVKWAKTKEIVTTVLGERVVTKAQAYGIKRRDAEGRQYHQQVAWADMTVAELEQVIDGSSSRMSAARDTIAVARRLRQLVEQAGVEPVGEALRKLGLTLEQALGRAA